LGQGSVLDGACGGASHDWYSFFSVFLCSGRQPEFLGHAWRELLQPIEGLSSTLTEHRLVWDTTEVDTLFGEDQLELLLVVLEGIGVLAFTVSGILVAARKQLDVVGVVVVAFLTALGGGTLRDVLLDRRPFFWVANEEWVWAVVALSVLGPIVIRARHLEPTMRAMQWPDALGLGLFAASGTQIALSEGATPLVATLMGVVTAAFGGVIRDILVNDVPWVVNSYQLYALIAFAGGWVVWGLTELGVTPVVSVLVGALAIVVTRMLAIAFDWRLPSWRLGDQA
jgi:uncharacterized membrane protein YeiH